MREKAMDGTITNKKARADQSTWRPQTRAVRGGQLRSNFDETSEALYLTSGYAYSSAEEADFQDDKPRTKCEQACEHVHSRR